MYLYLPLQQKVKKKCELNLYVFSELPNRHFVSFRSTMFKNQSLKICWIVLIWHVTMEAYLRTVKVILFMKCYIICKNTRSV